jgi:chaperonin GroEL
MHATKAAVEEGIVAGGGVALLRAGASLTALRKDSTLTDDERTGVGILARAIDEPLRWIAQNTGLEGSIVVAKVMDLTGDHGFNAETEKYEDLVKAGVIDPAKVVRCALQNAGSIAGLMLTTEAMVSERPDQDAAKSTPRGSMPGMEDYN